MTSLLILTVGTGTAGKHSDVAQGLANTIRQVRPRKFWLVPSASEKSTPVADLIRETVAELKSFAPWSESAPYHAIPNHDDIHECRRLVREVIAAAKRELRQAGDYPRVRRNQSAVVAALCRRTPKASSHTARQFNPFHNWQSPLRNRKSQIVYRIFHESFA